MGLSPLELCVVLDHQVVELLVSHGASVNSQNSDGHSALFFAYNGLNQVGGDSAYSALWSGTRGNTHLLSNGRKGESAFRLVWLGGDAENVWSRQRT